VFIGAPLGDFAGAGGEPANRQITIGVIMKFPIIQSNLVLGVVCAAAVVGGGCHSNRGAARMDDNDRRVGYAMSTPAETLAPDGVVFDLAALTSARDPQTYAGRPVQCGDARVQRVLDDQNVMIDAGDGRALCVHFQQPLRGLHRGDSVRFIGTVKNMSDTARMVVGLGDKASTAVRDETIFIDAREVEVNQ
jgi:hypothetical protein